MDYPEPDSPTVHRIALPRAVLAELRERFGVRSGEEQLSNSFTVTLAPSMPHDLVVPDHDVSDVLGTAVNHLRAAWKDAEPTTDVKELLAGMRAECAALTGDGLAGLAELRAQTAGTSALINRVERLVRMASVPNDANLRAAAAIVRGFFGAATLVSIDPSHARPAAAGTSVAGDYETHRRRIEKLLSRTRLVQRLDKEIAHELKVIEELGVVSSVPKVDQLIQKPQRSHAPALYSGELVWLLNEAGVIAQLQGRLKIAERHYREAFGALERFKGRGARMGWRRLTINDAFLKIERGRIAEARASLMAVAESIARPELRWKDETFSAANEEAICRPLVWGYLGLVDTLEGHAESARRNFRRAIPLLVQTRQQRALALFYWRLGSLELYLGDEESARRNLKLAIDEAGSGQQLDVVWRASLKATELSGEADRAMTVTIFREARAYATAMKLPRLEAMALHREAEWRMQREDLTVAAALATQAMCCATANGLTLMRIRLRTLMGEILLRQGDPSGEFLLHRAVSHANRIGYQLELNQARNALLRTQAGARA